ncbi:MAG: response regulator, partial [Gammaproteobacteria bacterium]|nr:response regulator [Gammaproteobacteria bacterium]
KTKINTQDNQKDFFNTLDDTYDLILTDYHMDDLNGDKVVEKIREKSIFTEILFYTAKADLKGTQKLDRISFLETTTDHEEEVVEKAKELIDLTIKKFQDIVVMRGMIMHETSTLDIKKVEILKKYIDSKNPSEVKDLKDKTLEEVKLFVDEKCNKYQHFNTREDGLKGLIKDNVLFSSARKIEALSWILKTLELEDFSAEYKDEIISPRNQFAHARLIEDSDRKYFKKGDSDTEFDREYCKKLRKNILKHKKNLDKLQNKLDE